jgi:hypothetical protein
MLHYERAVRAIAGLIPASQQLDIFFGLYGNHPTGRASAVGNPKPRAIQFDINNVRASVQGIRPGGDMQARVFDEAIGALKPLLPTLAVSQNRVDLVNEYANLFFGLRKPKDLAQAAIQGLRQRRYTEEQLNKFTEVAIRYNQHELVHALFEVGYRANKAFARDLVCYALMRQSLQSLKVLVHYIGWETISSWSVVSLVATRQSDTTRQSDKGKKLEAFTYTQHQVRQAVAIAVGKTEEELVESASAVANFDIDQSAHRNRVQAFERSLIQFAQSGLLDISPGAIRDDGILHNDELCIVANTIGRTLAEVKAMHLEELAPAVAHYAVTGSSN